MAVNVVDQAYSPKGKTVKQNNSSTHFPPHRELSKQRKASLVKETLPSEDRLLGFSFQTGLVTHCAGCLAG
jgi:hypothetical protein